ncbi:MAG: CRISPR-associated endonuclease Cas1 [Actinomycetota bacterium]|nr:CRISPR-associated endonuclease Cas1 [Actinomycetota bacterium]
MPESAYSPGVGRTLVAAGYGASIRVWRKWLVIVDGTGPDRRERTFEAATFDYSRLIVAADHGQVTLDAIRWLTDQGACLVQVDRSARVLAVAGDFAGDRPSLRRAQALAGTSPRGLEVARRLIGERVRGQLRVAVKQLEDEQAGRRLGDLLEAIGQARSIDGVRNLEAQAAGRYWQSWADVPITFAGPGSQARVPDHWRTFGSRHSPLSSSPRLAVTPANALLNYLMALLEAEARIACMGVGLDPGLGIVHADRAWRDSMACDVMEAVRADVESWLLRTLSERTFTLRDFAETQTWSGSPRPAASLVGRLDSRRVGRSRQPGRYLGRVDARRRTDRRPISRTRIPTWPRETTIPAAPVPGMLPVPRRWHMVRDV